VAEGGNTYIVGEDTEGKFGEAELDVSGSLVSIMADIKGVSIEEG